MKLRLLLIAYITALAGQTFAADTAADEQRIWERERSCWHDVEKNDAAAYSNLWHENFLGWPSFSSAPVQYDKEHIADWITSETRKGLVFKVDEFKPGAVKVTADVAFACYWITFRWIDKDGKGAPSTLRISHAWLRDGKDWRIIGGMSMPETENAVK
jgi:ketosteroid isomerase-like protein